jgi:hypothetical protein
LLSAEAFSIHLKVTGGLAQSSDYCGLSLAQPFFPPELFSNIFFMTVYSYLQYKWSMRIFNMKKISVIVIASWTDMQSRRMLQDHNMTVLVVLRCDGD